MSRALFDFLSYGLSQKTAFSHCLGPVSPQQLQDDGASQMLAVVLWRLASGNSVRTTASQFGCSESSVVRWTDIVCNCIFDASEGSFGLPPIGSRRQQETFEYFRAESAKSSASGHGFPRARGAIDCTHILLQRAPAGTSDPLAFMDRKGHYSMQVQAVCDEDMVFLDVLVGWPGSVHDARILRNSELFARSAETFSDGSYLLGDAGYPALPWLVPAFRDANRLTAPQIAFNHAHSRCRCVVERAFGLLKSRWRILRFADVSISTLPKMIAACFVLHNLCLLHGVDTSDLIITADEEAGVQPPAAEEDDESAQNGAVVRNILCAYMFPLLSGGD